MVKDVQAILRRFVNLSEWFVRNRHYSPISQATKKVALFGVFGIAWIVFSDHIAFTASDGLLWDFFEIQTLKGIAFVGITAMLMLVTYSKYEEHIFWRSRELEQIYDSLRIPLLIVDPATLKIAFANRAAAIEYGYSDEPLPVSLKVIYPDVTERILREASASYLKHSINAVHLRKDGRPIHVKVSVSYCELKGRFILNIVNNEEASELNQQLGRMHLASEQKHQKTIERIRLENARLTSTLNERDRINNELIQINTDLQDANKKYQDQAKNLLKQRDDFLSRIFSSVSDIVWSYDLAKRRFLYLSNSASRLLNESQEELFRCSDFSRFLHPDDEGVRGESRRKLYATGSAESTFRVVSKDGHVRWLLERAKLVYDDNGNPIRCEGIETDITYIKETEKIIEENRLSLDSIFDNVPAHLVLLTPEGKIIRYNRIASEQSEFFKMPLKRGENIELFLHDLWRSRFIQTLKTISVHHAAIEDEVVIDQQNGRKYYYVQFVPVTNYEGSLEQICFKLTDVTEKRNADGLSRESKKNVDALINNTSELLWSVDISGKLIISNIAFEKFVVEELGMRIEPDGELFPLNALGENWAVAFRDAARGRKLQISGRFFSVNGACKYYEAAFNPIVENDTLIGVACVLRDTTRRENIYSTLRAANARYKNLLKATNDAVWELDLRSGTMQWSRALHVLFGYRNCDLRTLDAWWDKVHPEDRRSAELTVVSAFEKTSPECMQRYRLRCADNSYKHVLARAHLTYENGKPVTAIGVIQDISELLAQEKAVVLSNERYRLACQASGDIIWDYDVQENTVYFSESFDRIFGCTSFRSRTDEWFSRIHPDDQFRTRTSWESFLSSTANNWTEEYRLMKKDGTYAYVISRASMLRNEAGEAIRIIGALIDETERMQSISEIKKLSLVARHNSNPVIVCDKHFRIEWANEAFKETVASLKHEVLGLSYWSLHTNNRDAHAVINQMSRTLLGGTPAKGDVCIADAQNLVKWVRIDATPVWDDAGDIEKFIIIQTDISQQVAYEKRIIAIAREFATVIENANAVIFGVDRNGYVNEWNKLTSHVTGFSRNDVYGKKFIEQINTDNDRLKLEGMLSSVLAGNSSSNIELRLLTKDGKETVLLLNATARKDEQGDVTGALIVGHEITELSDYQGRLEEKVEQRTKELNAALKKEIELADMKKRFVSVASHEFRTPLSTINFAAGFLRKYRNRLVPDQIDLKLQTIEQQVRHMTFLLDDVLTIGKSEASAIQVRPASVNICSFFEGLSEELQSAYHDSHRVNVEHEGSRVFLYTDEKLLRNIFSNLISNAIKFSPAANVVTVRLFEIEACIAVDVIDFGIGVDPDDHAHIFEAFQRGKNAVSIQGTGLGLNIVKRSVELLNGSLSMRSVPGKGSTFSVRIPDYKIEINQNEGYGEDGYVNKSIAGR